MLSSGVNNCQAWPRKLPSKPTLLAEVEYAATNQRRSHNRREYSSIGSRAPARCRPGAGGTSSVMTRPAAGSTTAGRSASSNAAADADAAEAAHGGAVGTYPAVARRICTAIQAQGGPTTG